MKKGLMLLALVLFFVVPAQAQDSIHFYSVKVDIWPEFDRPAVLVIYHLTLVEDTILPALVEIRIPAQAEINAVAMVDSTNGLFNAQYERTVDGDWATLSITATSLDFQVEYYDVLVKNGTTRYISFAWPGGIAVDAFTASLQNPTGSTDLQMDPAPVRTENDSYNLPNSITQTLSLSAGEAFTLNAQYEKITDDLSVAGLPVQPSQPLEDTSGQVVWSSILPWVIGGLGLGLIVLGLLVLFSFLRSGQRNGRRGKAKHAGKKGVLPTETMPEKESMIYCHECGNRARPGDQFCRTCGSRLRLGE